MVQLEVIQSPFRVAGNMPYRAEQATGYADSPDFDDFSQQITLF